MDLYFVVDKSLEYLGDCRDQLLLLKIFVHKHPVVREIQEHEIYEVHVLSNLNVESLFELSYIDILHIFIQILPEISYHFQKLLLILEDTIDRVNTVTVPRINYLLVIIQQQHFLDLHVFRGHDPMSFFVLNIVDSHGSIITDRH